MQSYGDVPASTKLVDSRQQILDNDATALSCSSGTSFPTTNLQVGMLCFRTDQNKLYQLVTTDPAASWVVIADVSKTITDKGYVDGALADKADLDSPELTGSPTAPTPAADAEGTEIATAEFVLSKSSAAAAQGLAKVTTDDTTAGVLNDKIDVLGNGLTKSVVNAGANEQIQLKIGKVDSAAAADSATSANSATNSVKWGGATKYVSTAGPSGGADGDIWFQYTA